MKHGIAAVAVLSLCACAHRDVRVEFAHLRLSSGAIQSTHAMRYEVRAQGFNVAGPVDRTDLFDGHPYEISLAAFIGEGQAVMVHGERVADASGASNYDNLPEASWPNGAFRVRSMCVVLAPGDIQGEHDLEWLRANGFDPVGSLALEQSFTTTVDHNNELVISLAVKDVDCADPAAVEAALAQLRERVTVRRLD